MYFYKIPKILKLDSLDFSGFTAVSDQDWYEKIKKELKVNDLSEIKESQQFAINPKLRNNEPKDLIPKESNHWHFGLSMDISEPKLFNTKLKKFLGWGMNAFEVRLTPDLNLNEAFDGIFLNMVYPIFHVKDHDHLISLKKFLEKRETDRIAIHGDGIEVKEGTDTLLFAKASNQYLQTVGNIRSLRQSPYHPDSHKIVSYICTSEEEKYHPLIELTSQSVASVSGGGDIVLADEKNLNQDENLIRLVINIHNILSMESHMHIVDDPLKGSYLIEGLTQ